MSVDNLLLKISNDFTTLSASVKDLIDFLLAEQPVEKVVLDEAFNEALEEKAKPEITLEEVRAVLGEKSHKKGNTAVRELLKKYGAEKLSAVDPKDYPALLTDAEVL